MAWKNPPFTRDPRARDYRGSEIRSGRNLFDVSYPLIRRPKDSNYRVVREIRINLDRVSGDPLRLANLLFLGTLRLGLSRFWSNGTQITILELPAHNTS